MLRITIHDSPEGRTYKLEGKLAGAWVRELDECWRTSGQSGGAATTVDLSRVGYIDEVGKALLARMHAAGAVLKASGPLNKAIVDEIVRAGKVTVVIFAFLAIVAIGGLRAQEPKPESGPLRLNLREAVQMALRQNPQVQIANLSLAQSNEERKISRSGLLPQGSFQVFEREQRFNLEAFIGTRFPGTAQHAGPFETFQAGPLFSMPIFDLTLWRRWRASEAGVNAARAEAQNVREQIAALVVSQYLGTLRAAADVEAARSRVDLAQALYNQAADMQKSGVGTGLDTLRANVELQNERQRLINAETTQKTTLFGLSRLLNIDPTRPVELTDQVSFFETPAIQLDESLERAYSARPEMRALTYREQQAERLRQAASAERVPSLRLDGFWSYQGLKPSSVIPAYQYTATLNFPLFTSGRIGAEIARAEQEIKKVGQQRTETRNQIALEVKTAAAQLDAARHEVEVANMAVKLAREEVNQARDRFQAGVANNIEVITAQDALARANDNQIVALYRYNQARADLARATGQMENLYAK